MSSVAILFVLDYIRTLQQPDSGDDRVLLAFGQGTDDGSNAFALVTVCMVWDVFDLRFYIRPLLHYLTR